MVRTASPPGQSSAKARRRGNSGVIILLLVAVFVAGALFVVGFLSPTRLVIPQEHLLGILHGGVADVAEQTIVECVPLDQTAGQSLAITRFTRTIIFRDQTSLVVTFNTSPAATQFQCAAPQ